MIDEHFVVQGQRVIAIALVIADARVALHDQSVDVKLAETRRDGEPRLPAADDDYRGIAIGIGRNLAPLIRPIFSAEVTQIRRASRTALANARLEAGQFIERSGVRPCA